MQTKNKQMATRDGDTANVVRKQTKKSDEEFFQCDPSCKVCNDFHTHKKRDQKARYSYKFDKDSVGQDPSTLYILLPRMPGYKLCCFTTRLVTINQTFAPIRSLKKHNLKPLAVLWIEAIAGRKDEDEDVSSAYVKALLSPNFRDYPRWVVWLDNCSGQNKCWTLYTTLIRLLNSENVNLERITLKYFTAGHTFMSANNVHRGVEREMKKMDKLCDFADFEKMLPMF